MKKLAWLLFIPLIYLGIPTAYSATDHDKMMGMGNITHEEVIEGVKASFQIF